jgi:hypothetical protein
MSLLAEIIAKSKEGRHSEEWDTLRNAYFREGNGWDGFFAWAAENNLEITRDEYFDDKGEKHTRVTFHQKRSS